MTRTFHEEAQRVILALEPVGGHHVGAEVVAEEDDAAIERECRVEVVSTGDGEEAGDFGVGEAVQEAVAGAPADLVAGEFAADLGEVPVLAEMVAALADGFVDAASQTFEQGVFRATNAGDQVRGEPRGQTSKDGQDAAKEIFADVQTTTLHELVAP